ncbi:MAG: PAS domain S-box protein [Vicinamibacterales bacterium]
MPSSATSGRAPSAAAVAGLAVVAGLVAWARLATGWPYPPLHDVALALVVTALIALIVVQRRALTAEVGRVAAQADALRAEAAARKDFEHRFRLLVDGVVDYAIFLLDTRGYVVTWNSGAERLTGYTKTQIIGTHFSICFPADAVAAGEPARDLARARADGRCEHQAWRVRRDGSRFWAHTILTALRDERGELRGFAKVTRDMTARRRADVLIDSVMDNVVDGILGIDDAGTVEWFNASAERLFGWAPAAIVGRPLSDLLPDIDVSGGFPPPAGIGRELSARRADGSTFPVELAVGSYALDDRRHYTGVVRDVTTERRLEEQLRQAQKMEAIGLLAGGVAHDFNNLLTVISGYAALLLQDDGRAPGARDAQMLQAIADAGDRASSLTRQLLAFSRQAVLEPRVLDLNGVVLETERMLRRLIGEDIRLVSALAPDLPAVRVDPGQMSQVLLNLAVNARDAMPRGGQLTVETAETELDASYQQTHPDVAAGRYVRLSVTDTGCGMSPEVKARIFEPFFTTKSAGRGTGLGLATVYGIVRQSGGHIGLYTEVGQGSSFKIYLPIVTDGTEVESPAFDAAEVGRGTETILLVEDEEAVREFAVLALQARGYTVLTARHGQDALRVFREQADRVDLLLTDVVMPGMSGRELAETLRTTHPELRVLYQSGYTDDAVVRHGLLQAEVAFLQKPYTPWSLARKVRQVLDQAPHPIVAGD